MTIETAEALYRLGRLAPEQLGDLGVALLAAGADTPAVRELAGLDRHASWRDAGDVFDRALVELGRPALTERAAAYVIATEAALAITAGRVAPHEGAARIGAAYHAAGQPEDLARFYYWADEWDDHPEYRAACEADIARAARDFLDGRGGASA